MGRREEGLTQEGLTHEGLTDLTVALIQLPVPDPDPAAARANVPLAAGYLKAACGAARMKGAEVPHPSRIHVIPRSLANHGGDAAVLAWLRSLSPDLVGFTSSMWNVQRNLWLAERIRELPHRAQVMMGGPEIVENAGVLASPHVDSFVIGEGEAAFVDALEDLGEGRSPRRVHGSGAPLDLARIPNPYLAGAVERDPEDPLHLETMRGCAHHCSYCHYARAMPGLRQFPRSRLGEIFPWARARGVPEIYLMDPSFTSAPGWEESLGLIAGLNTTAIPLHAEIRLEAVTPARADLMLAAGIRSVEVGLQSTNGRALRAVRRSWRRDAFVRGAALLRARGITVRTGIILGLPEDTVDGFAATVDFLVEQGLAADMEVYPLALLPGTALRAQASARGIRFMPWPPWEVLSTPTMGTDEIVAALFSVQERLGTEMFPPLLPMFQTDLGGFTGFIDLRSSGAEDSLAAEPERLAISVTLLFDKAQFPGTGLPERIASVLLRETPHSLFQLVVASDAPLSPAALERATEAFHSPAHYFNQAGALSPDPRGRFSVRLFRLTSASAARRSLDPGAPDEACEIIVRFHPSLLSDGGQLLAERPLLLLEDSPAPEVSRALAGIYRGFEQRLLRSERPL